MGLEKSFNAILKKHEGVYAAWPPFTNTFKLGDYGIFKNGVFEYFGNVSEFGAEIIERKGNESTLNFVSQGVKTFNLGADGNAVTELPVGEVEAKLKFVFQKGKTFSLKGKITSLEMANKNQVARKIKDHPDWQRRFKVVSRVITGHNCVFLGAEAAGTEFTISGKANVLKDVIDGNVNGAVGITSSNGTVMDRVGKVGPIGLGLFRINWRGRIKSKSLEEEVIEYEVDNDLALEVGWGTVLADDLAEK